MPASKRAEGTRASKRAGQPATARADARPAKRPRPAPPAPLRTVARPDKLELLRRLNRIEGQVRGVAQMIEADRYCIDVLTQLAAIRSALDATALGLTENHVHHCVSGAIEAGNGHAAVDELMRVLRRFAR